MVVWSVWIKGFKFVISIVNMKNNDKEKKNDHSKPKRWKMKRQN